VDDDRMIYPHMAARIRTGERVRASDARMKSARSTVERARRLIAAMHRLKAHG